MNGMYGKRGAMTGKAAWSRGLNKQTSKILEKLGRKISLKLREKFQSGELSHAGTKNPMYGRKKNTMKHETIEKYRNAAIERIIKGVSGYKTGHVTGNYYSTKADKMMKYKSSWELATMMVFDTDSDIISYDYEPEKILLSDGRSAIPDFVVKTKSGEIIYYEVKPSALQSLPNIFEKLTLTKNAIVSKGKKYILLGDNEIEKFKEKLGVEFDAAIKANQGGR